MSTLTEKIGSDNIDQVLVDNGLSRTPQIGKQWKALVEEIISTHDNVPAQSKITLLNKFLSDSDIYEEACIATEDEWKVLWYLGTFLGYLKLSDEIEAAVPDSYDVLGNDESVSAAIYNAVRESLIRSNSIDSSIFSYFSTIKNVGLSDSSSYAGESNSNPMSWFNIPQGRITLYSSLSGDGIDIPAYPEDLADGRTATYTTMPDIIYQYEPWQMYQGSGPRTNIYKFHLHRDMWTGDHSDGKANELIRFCQAQCYPDYNGSAVNTSTVTLYVAGHALITGIMTDVSVEWMKPIGLDGWYLDFNLNLTITEVSPSSLNYKAVLNKPLIG